MAKRKRPITLILGLAAGLALVLGIVSIFGLPENSVWEVLLPLVVLIVAGILLGLVAATVIAWLRRYFGRRR